MRGDRRQPHAFRLPLIRRTTCPHHAGMRKRPIDKPRVRSAQRVPRDRRCLVYSPSNIELLLTLLVAIGAAAELVKRTLELLK